MSHTARPFRVAGDYEAVRRLLVESYPAYGKLLNWGLDRWDFHRFFVRWQDELSGTHRWEAESRVWVSAGRLVGVIHPEDPGSIHLQVHPEHRHLEGEMIAWAMERHAASSHEPLCAYPMTADRHRLEVLGDLGWAREGPAGAYRAYRLDAPIPERALPPGYRLRSLDPRSPDDLARRALLGNAAFGHQRNTADRIRMLLRAPTYRADLDLMVEAPDGTFAAYACMWWAEENRYVSFEPVGTHPDHRRLGLASAVMAEGLRRASVLGASVAYVGVDHGSPANLVYAQLGFTGIDPDERWVWVP